MTSPSDIRRQFADAVAGTISRHQMIREGDRILVGFSGGPDSTALARILMELAPDLGFSIGLAHLNHGLRGEDADRDEAFARAFAADHNLELNAVRVDIKALAAKEKQSIEDAGRKARYAFYQQVLTEKGYTRIATGHHRDDHTEQVLMNLVRGTGPTGLKGISPVREDGVIRPLIRRTKSDILAYLTALDQPFVTDASNEDPAFLRNRVRHRLMPFMEKEFNPELRAGLDRLSRIISQEDAFMDQKAAEVFGAALLQHKTETLTLSLDPLNGCHPAIACRVIRKAIHRVKQNLKRISQRHIQDILELAGASETGKHLDLPGRIRVYRQKDALLFRKEALPLRTLGQREKYAENKP